VRNSTAKTTAQVSHKAEEHKSILPNTVNIYNTCPNTV